MRKIVSVLPLLVSLLTIAVSMQAIEISLGSQNNVTNYEYTLWVGGYRYGYTVNGWSIYPLHVYNRDGTFIKTFHVTRKSTKWDWPNSGTSYTWPGWGTFDDPYGEDATCPPGVYWGSYDNIVRKGISTSSNIWDPVVWNVDLKRWEHNGQQYTGPLYRYYPRIIIAERCPALINRTIHSDLGTSRGGIQIHRLGNEMLGCMGVPDEPDLDINMTILAAYLFDWESTWQYQDSHETSAASYNLRVIINPADFGLSYLTLTSSAGGDTNPLSGDTYIYPYGTQGDAQGDTAFEPLISKKFAEVKAIPSPGYCLDCWELDGITYGGPYGGRNNPTYVDMITSHTLRAVFKHSVGGVVTPVDKSGLLAPYIGLASTILVGTVASTIFVKRVKRRKEK